MGFRIVVEREGKKTFHEVAPGGVVLGRDPSCELFFDDRRLSRRHVRFESVPGGVRLQDLGSRNGCWIDSKRVNETTLRPGTEVLLGGLRLSVESDVPETVALDVAAMSPSPSPSPSPSDDKTVVLPKEPKRTEEPDAGDKTRLLPKDPQKVPDTAKRPLASKPSKPSKPQSTMPKTRVLTPEDLAPLPAAPAPAPVPVGPTPGPEADAEPEAELDSGAASGYSWPARFVLVASALAFIVYFTLAFPLMRTLSNSLREESLRRGRALLDVLAARNEEMVGEGRLRDLSVESVLREERVKEAVLVDLDGKVLAPSSRAGEVLSGIDGIDASIAEVRTFYLGRRRNGDYVLVQPLLYQSRRVGLAVVAYEAATASASFAVAILFLAFLVALVGILVALVIGKRMTLAPIGILRDDIEAVIKGDLSRVPQGQAFAELSEVARSVNRLLARARARERARPVAAAAPVPGAAPVPPAPPARPAPPVAPAPPASRAPMPAPTPPLKAAAPEPSPSRAPTPATPSPTGTSSEEGHRLWIDEGFVVVQAEPGAVELLGASSIAGKHLLEAVSDQTLLEVLLDAVNGLEQQAVSEAQTTSLSARATREGGHIVVTLCKL